ncbi:MAG: LptA/OstA family protein [Thermoanaerobaculia bacterium]
MRARSRRRELPINLLRHVLLAVLVAFLIAMGAIYVRGRRQKGSPTPLPSRERPADSEQTLVLSGMGFDYEITEGGRKIFHIKAERVVSQREDEYTLEGVEVTLVRQDGTEYRVQGRSANYDMKTQAASMRGDVVFRGPREVELKSDGLELRRGGKLLVSTAPVEFVFLGRFGGRAERMRINTDSDTFHLAGKVEVETLPGDASPMSLRCRRFTYERQERLVRSEGEVVLQRRGDELRARRLTLTLSEDEQSVRFVRAYWNVVGGMQQDSFEGLTARVRFAARRLSVVFEEASHSPVKAELEGDDAARAALSWSDGAGLTRRIQSDYLVGDFEQGTLRRAQAFDRVEIDEYITFAEERLLRKLCADSADAILLADGSLAKALLEGEVDLQEGGLQAHGDRMVADGTADTVELFGDLAWLVNDRGRLDAPRIVYAREDGRIRATEGVRAIVEVEGQIALGNASGDGDQPIRVQAREAEWSSSPSTVLFREEVRAWQGENFLLANELLGEPELSRLTASGNVRTVWRPELEESLLRPDGEASQEDQALEVTAQQLVYEQDEHLMTYTGGSRADQAGRSIRCAEIRLRQAEGGGFEELICEGAARLEDPQNGKTVTGERVIYLPQGSTARIFGRPVVMRDVDGTEIQGRMLIYDFDSGTAEIQSESEAEETSEEPRGAPR